MAAMKSPRRGLSRVVPFATAGCAALVTLTIATALLPSPSHANRQFQRDTGKPCGYCHVAGNEPALNAEGNQYRACGYAFCETRPRPQPAPVATAPSFSCSGNLSQTESVICSDDLLSRLDVELAASYASKVDGQRVNEQAATRALQRDWLSRRESCGADKQCIRREYSGRLDELAANGAPNLPATAIRPPPRAQPSNEPVSTTVLGHNGSTVEMLTRPNHQVEMRYAGVRPGLPVEEGTVLFRGTISDRGELAGTAYVFKRGCPAAGYEVSGWQMESRIVLNGAAPSHAPGSCSIAGYNNHGSNARLEFTIGE